MIVAGYVLAVCIQVLVRGVVAKRDGTCTTRRYMVQFSFSLNPLADASSICGEGFDW